MKTLYDDYEIIELLDRRNNNRYCKVRCKVCGHEKEISFGNIIKQDNHHSCKNCRYDYYKEFVGKKYGDYLCERIEYESKEKGFIATMKCEICGHILKTHTSNLKIKKHSPFVCEEDYQKSLIGTQYGDLIITGIHGRTQFNEVLYDCKCSVCGMQSTEKLQSLKRNIQHGTHCLKLLPDDGIKKIITWRFYNMYQRCNNPNNKHYENYGGRGIKLLYKNAIDLYFDFAEEIKEFAKTHDIRNCTFDRINVDGNYEKSNLRIASQTVQNTNTTRKKMFILEKGNERILSDCAMECGRYLNLNGHSIGNVVRGTSKSSGGWRLYRNVDLSENIDDVVANEGVTTKLIIS